MNTYKSLEQLEKDSIATRRELDYANAIQDEDREEGWIVDTSNNFWTRNDEFGYYENQGNLTQ